ncbi:hypothetical protein APSETT444_009008 [Aspergillus pseudonomiae]
MNHPETAEFLCGLDNTDVTAGSLSSILDVLNSLSILSTDSDNMPAMQARARKVASQALPPFSLGPNHTKSNALHDIEFVDELHHWSNLLRFVETYVQDQIWSNKVVKILMTKNTQLKVVGELKVPWVYERGMREAYGEEAMLRPLLAQPIKYMKDLNCIMAS